MNGLVTYRVRNRSDKIMNNVLENIINLYSASLDLNHPAESEDDKGKSPLYFACAAACEGHPEALQLIFEKLTPKKLAELDFNHPAENENNKGQTPLYLACAAACKGHPEALQLIFEKLTPKKLAELDFNHPAEDENNKGQTPLYLACFAAGKGHPEALQLIFEKLTPKKLAELDFNHPAENEDEKGQTPLHFACAAAGKGHPEALQLIFEKLTLEQLAELDFNHPAENENQKGQTPLYLVCFAACIGHPKALQGIISIIPGALLDFESILDLKWNNPDIKREIKVANRYSLAFSKLNDYDFVSALEIFENISKLEAGDSAILSWLKAEASFQICSCLLARPVDKFGGLLTNHQVMERTELSNAERTLALEHALYHALAANNTDSGQKQICVKQLLDDKALGYKGEEYAWLDKYSSIEDILSIIKIIKFEKRLAAVNTSFEKHRKSDSVPLRGELPLIENVATLHENRTLAQKRERDLSGGSDEETAERPFKRRKVSGTHQEQRPLPTLTWATQHFNNTGGPVDSDNESDSLEGEPQKKRQKL